MVYILGDGNASSTLGINLTVEASETEGMAVGPRTDAAGIPITTVDTGHVKLTVLTGKFLNGTAVVVISLANTGQQNITIYFANIVGQNPYGSDVLDAWVVGCTRNYQFPEPVSSVYPNGTTVTQVKTATYACSEPSATESITIMPGSSFAAYIKGVFTFGSEPIVKIGAGATYVVSGVEHAYSIRADYNTA